MIFMIPPAHAFRQKFTPLRNLFANPIILVEPCAVSVIIVASLKR